MMGEIEIIAHDPDGSLLNDVTLTPNGRKFVLGVPESILEDCDRLGIQSRFFTENTTPSYYGYEGTDELESVTGIRGLSEMIHIATFARSAKLIEKIQKSEKSGGEIPHNGTKYGVSTISEGRSQDGFERLQMNIGIHETTWFTSLVMGDVYVNLRKIKHPALSDARLSGMPHPQGEGSYAIFFNSLGLNTSVSLREGDGMDRPYIFGTRPSGELHVAMNEGLHPSPDIAGLPSFTLESLYKRGMKEELGLTITDESHLSTPTVREVFLVKSVGQFGIHMYSELDMTLDELKARHARAKDRKENTAFVAAAFNQKGLAFATLPDSNVVPYTRDLIHGLIVDFEM